MINSNCIAKRRSFPTYVKHESHLYVAELNDDLVSFKNEPLLISKPDQKWELYSGPEWLWNEGPFVLKRNDKYYLMYSANFYASNIYSVGYAVAKNPSGDRQICIDRMGFREDDSLYVTGPTTTP